MQVLYVVGYPRVGSTVFGNILNEVPGLVHLGEIVHTASMMERDRDVCGCGRPRRKCEFWQEVHARTPDLRDPGALYESLAQATGADWLVDTSKSPAHLEVVRNQVRPDRLAVLHLLRDPRGSIHSRMRGRRARQARVGAKATPLTDVARTARDARRLVHDVRASSQVADLEVRYETFTSDPRLVVSQVLDLIDLDANLASKVVSCEGVVELGTNHGMVGNQNRLRTGPVEVRADDRWRHEMRAPEREVVWAIAGRTARRHGYQR